jgi:hypothetical protein
MCTLSSEHTGQELMRTLSIWVRKWCVRWAYGSGTDTVCSLSTRVRNWCMNWAQIWNLKRPFKTCWAYVSGDVVYTEHMRKELKRTLSTRISSLHVCSTCAQEIYRCPAPPIIKIINIYFCPTVTYLERLYGVKIIKTRAIENLTLGHHYSVCKIYFNVQQLVSFFCLDYYSPLFLEMCWSLYYLSSSVCRRKNSRTLIDWLRKCSLVASSLPSLHHHSWASSLSKLAASSSSR